MLESIKLTKSNETNIEIIFRADETDELLNNNVFMMKCFEYIDIRLYINFLFGPETFPDLGTLWNEAYKECTGDYIQYGGDDLVYETKDWDIKVVNGFAKFSDEIVLVWASDSSFGSSLATHGFLSKKWVDTLGWVFPPNKMTYANDNMIHNIAAKLSRLFYIGEVNIKHIWDGGNREDPNYGRMGKYFQQSWDILNGEEGQGIINGAVERLRKEMK